MKIFLSVATALLLIGCSGDTEQKSEPVKPVSQKQEVVKQELPAQAPVVEKVAPKPEPVKEAVPAPKPKVEEKNVAKMPKTVAPQPLANGRTLYQSCVSCHGTDASKKALNKSQVIKGWDAAKIEKALKGYKDGSYGGSMKSLMQGQVKKLSDEEIKVLSDYIAHL